MPQGPIDGRLDGHFRIALDLDPGREIASMTLMSSQPDGTPTGQVWGTGNTSYWALGVTGGAQATARSRAHGSSRRVTLRPSSGARGPTVDDWEAPA